MITLKYDVDHYENFCNNSLLKRKLNEKKILFNISKTLRSSVNLVSSR